MRRDDIGCRRWKDVRCQAQGHDDITKANLGFSPIDLVAKNRPVPPQVTEVDQSAKDAEADRSY